MRKFLLTCLITCLVVIPTSAQEITIAAAADLNAALTEIVRQYSATPNVSVKLSFGASGNLFNQIRNGAPFDIFFSADEDYPKQLIEQGLAEKNTLYRYAVGRLVLWVPTDSPVDIDHKGLQSLNDPYFKKIAIANPQHAPYGRAAVAALRTAGVYDQISDRLVLGENVSQAAQFVESGNAQAGLVALSHALAPAMKGKGRYWEVPLNLYPTLNQAAVILSHSQNKAAAMRFLEYLNTAPAQSVLKNYGFSHPSERKQ
ncbi:MAG TPA: molybdate ABC transporter substrate-binding protein [Terriglobales bacterium]|nr:molybdate ABC transporter substrate-binding protein [Terriglobales bacterium]